jgi:hypothetical protein
MFSRKNTVGTERLSRSIAAYHTGIGMRGAAVRSLPAKQPYFVQAAQSESIKPVQLLSITTHGQGNAKRSGGGLNSGIDTGAEVQTIIDAKNESDIRNAIDTLNLSIQNRTAYSYLFAKEEPNHAARLEQEKEWLSDLKEALILLQKNHAANLHRTMNSSPATVSVTHHGEEAKNGSADNKKFVGLDKLTTQDNDTKTKRDG